MAGSDPQDVASASIVCDPTNYDWIEDDAPGMLLTITSTAQVLC